LGWPSISTEDTQSSSIRLKQPYRILACMSWDTLVPGPPFRSICIIRQRHMLGRRRQISSVQRSSAGWISLFGSFRGRYYQRTRPLSFQKTKRPPKIPGQFKRAGCNYFKCRTERVWDPTLKPRTLGFCWSRTGINLRSSSRKNSCWSSCTAWLLRWSCLGSPSSQSISVKC